jgi:hypothetical protein
MEEIKQEELEKVGLEIAVEQTKAFMKGFATVEALSPAALEQIAVDQGLTTILSDAFSSRQVVPGLGAPFTMTQQAFQLTEETPIGSPIEATDAIFVMALEEIIPDHPPTLDEVRPRVTADFKRDKGLDAARAEASSVYQAIKASMDSGKGFEEACAELGQTAVQVPDFSLASRSLDGFSDTRITVSWLQDLAFALEAGELSEVSNTSTGAGILFVKGFKEADPAKMEEELEAHTQQLKQSGRSQTLSAWAGEEAASIQFFTSGSETGSESAAN